MPLVWTAGWRRTLHLPLLVGGGRLGRHDGSHVASGERPKVMYGERIFRQAREGYLVAAIAVSLVECDCICGSNTREYN